jgi:hypothetical protein
VSEIRISLPVLFPEQDAIAAQPTRFTTIAGGQFSGKSTLAIDLAIMSPNGALHGNPVALCLPDEAAVLKAKRRVANLLQPLIVGRMDRPRLDLSTGGSILFVAMDAETLSLWDQVALVVIDDAHKMPRVYDDWMDVLKPMLARRRGRAFIFGKPQGVRNGFYKIFAEAERDADYGSLHLATASNPHFPAERLQKAREELTEDTFAQEYEGLFIDAPIELSVSQTIIGRDETFRQWCQRLAEDGLLVDGHPFTFEDRPAMWFLYDQIPSTIEEAYEKVVVLMKCTQVGFTVAEILAMIYLSLKFMPITVGMYLPNRDLASIKSSDRFMPILRTIPAAYVLLTGEDESGKKGKGEGNIMRRNVGGSKFYFLWTSGKGATESVPMDVISLDEVQEMAKADIEKVAERMSASRLRFTLAGSTANDLDEDIHWMWKRGTKHQFHTRCPSCGKGSVLDEYFPDCIRLNPIAKLLRGKPQADYQYVCRHCDGWITNPQDGEWIAQDPEAETISIHYPQMLSPTITARQIITKYHSADDMKNFFNRVLGKPYTDPSQVPVNLEMLEECARIGMGLGVKWKTRAANTYMGIDQMGSFNVALIAERLPSGHMAIIHAEVILAKPTPDNPDVSPFDRCGDLMELYGVQVCVVETLPNYNDAKRFAAKFPGRVFLAGYAELKESMLMWGDSVPSKQERKTAEADQDRYTVTLDQYKVMQVALKRIQERATVFPDPDELTQEVLSEDTRGDRVVKRVLRDIIFFHFTRTALVAMKDEEQHKYKRKVIKVGIDPHFSYAYMLLYVAWARAHGTTTFLFPDEAEEPELVERPGAVVNSKVIQIVREQTAAIGVDTCGDCANQLGGYCGERFVNVKDADPACDLFLRAEV